MAKKKIKSKVSKAVKSSRATKSKTSSLSASSKTGIYELKLYVAGQTPKSLKAFENLKKICDKYLDGKYKLEVIDLLRHPQLARNHEILALPTLVRNLPTPISKIIGDLSNTEKVLVSLNIRTLNEMSESI